MTSSFVLEAKVKPNTKCMPERRKPCLGTVGYRRLGCWAPRASPSHTGESLKDGSKVSVDFGAKWSLPHSCHIAYILGMIPGIHNPMDLPLSFLGLPTHSCQPCSVVACLWAPGWLPSFKDYSLCLLGFGPVFRMLSIFLIQSLLKSFKNVIPFQLLKKCSLVTKHSWQKQKADRPGL